MPVTSPVRPKERVAVILTGVVARAQEAHGVTPEPQPNRGLLPYARRCSDTWRRTAGRRSAGAIGATRP